MAAAQLARSAIDAVGIVRVYEIATHTTVTAPERGGNHRVKCPSRGHIDGRPSCDLSPAKDAFVCRSCGESGGKLDLIIAAGHAQNRRDAAVWLERETGHESRAYVPRRVLTAADVDRFVRSETRLIVARETSEIGLIEPMPILSRHVAAARRRVLQNHDVDAAAENALRTTTPTYWWEEQPHCTDPLWRLFVERAVEERASKCEVPPSVIADAAKTNPRLAEGLICDAAVRLRELVKDGRAT